MRLTELEPREIPTNNIRADTRITFRCPSCRLGAVIVDLKLGPFDPKNGSHATTALPPAWGDMSITPSIDDVGMCRHCNGWHGHITNGEVR